ncbi:ABC-2 type transport system permease protein [Lederbergia galactosidilyticus]|uniref:ABC transporter permease n=1 Tax=Lederbergia galactosidilytica TaxID=217031 RepID=UPI001AEAD488|nr:ABC transporter permease [Lederbergia galactosidilytica]MBP1917473.1 ABC-2 type transport system permease protein [Lederbergia galactosidilytica]
MVARYFKGTNQLTAFYFKQQRFKILVWLIGLIGITLSVASAYPSIYNDEESRQAASLTMDNPVMVAMLGTGYEMEEYVNSVGAVFANEMLLFTAIAVAIMSILLVGRATRGDEEEGRIEMVRALSVGRLSSVSAIMIVIVSTNILLAILTGIGLASLGIEGVDLEGSLLYGSILGATGLLFASFTAVFAQVTETSRGTTMFSFMLLILAYLIRAIGDVSSEELSWISPLGWTVKTGVFVENDWWPVVLSCIVAIMFGVIAFYLHSIRDLGAGFIAARKGKTHASPFLQTSLGLALRLQRTNIIAWAIGLFILSSSFGAILGDLETYFAENEFMQAFIVIDSDYTMTEQFITLLMAIMSLISLVPAVMVILKVKGEETRNLTENYYTRAISRTRVLGSHFLLAVVVSFIMQSLVALGLWSVGEVVMDEAISFDTTFASAYVYLPAIWVVISLVIGLVGVVPKLTGLIWLYVVFCFVVVYLGDLFDFPEWMNNLSVFDYIPQIPIDNVNFMAMVVLILISFVLSIIGFSGYNRRDISG